MATLTLKKLRKAYSETIVPVKDIDLTVNPGEFLTLLGPSGCGKSTILRLIAGLESPTAGEVWIGDRDVSQATPGERDIAMVFQSYALYPHMTVADNIASGLKQRKVPLSEIQNRIYEVCQFLGLEALLQRKPGQLSGGQRQRVAVARALVRNPQVFLLDEPLSNLDSLLREQVRSEIKQLFGALEAPVIYVTHDQTEAMSLSTRVAVLNGGEIQQIGTPQEIYQLPANRFVAEFVGTPKMNFFTLPVHNQRIALGQLLIPVPPTAVTEKAIIIGIRPEHLKFTINQNTEQITGQVTLVEHLGMTNLVTIVGMNSDGSKYTVRAMLPLEVAVAVDQSISLLPALEQIHWFHVETGQRL